MSTAEDASALFGSSDPGADPFGAVLNADDAAEADTSALFGASADTDDLFGTPAENGWDVQPPNGHSQTDHYPAQQAQAHQPSHGAPAGQYQQPHQSQSSGQWTGNGTYGGQQAAGQNGYGGYYPAGQTPAAQTPYDPYAPPAVTHPATPAYGNGSQATPAYGGYAGGASQYYPTTPAAPAQAAPASGAYNPSRYAPAAAPSVPATPYTPATSYAPTTPYTPAAPYASNAYTPAAGGAYTPTTSGTPAAMGIPAPPAPTGHTVSAYRPTRANAYDPPVPTKARRGGARGTPAVPPAPPAATYGAFRPAAPAHQQTSYFAQGPTQAPLPPPPPPARGAMGSPAPPPPRGPAMSSPAPPPPRGSSMASPAPPPSRGAMGSPAPPPPRGPAMGSPAPGSLSIRSPPVPAAYSRSSTPSSAGGQYAPSGPGQAHTNGTTYQPAYTPPAPPAQGSYHPSYAPPAAPQEAPQLPTHAPPPPPAAEETHDAFVDPEAGTESSMADEFPPAAPTQETATEAEADDSDGEETDEEAQTGDPETGADVAAEGASASEDASEVVKASQSPVKLDPFWDDIEGDSTIIAADPVDELATAANGLLQEEQSTDAELPIEDAELKDPEADAFASEQPVLAPELDVDMDVEQPTPLDQDASSAAPYADSPSDSYAATPPAPTSYAPNAPSSTSPYELPKAATNPYQPPKAATNPYAPPTPTTNPYAPPTPAANPYAPPPPAANPYAPPPPAANPYAPPPPALNPYAPPRPAANPYAPPPVTTGPYAPTRSATEPYVPSSATMSPRQSLDSTSPYDPYRPSASSFAPYGPGSASPGAMATSPNAGSPYGVPPPPTAGPYAPPPPRSMSDGMPAAATAYSPYAPSGHSRDSSQASQFSTTPGFGSSPYPPVPPAPAEYTQEIALQPPAHAPYAPSPTLLGTNDPLGRVAGRAPLISMGFGGKLVTCFHGAGSLNTGFDVALAARQSTDVRIRELHDAVPASALELAEDAFPGPLFGDPGTPTATSLVRTGAAQAKAKKAKVLKYLEDRVAELERGLGYFHAGSDQLQQMEGKLVLVQLLKVMVENDGRLSGIPAAETAIRAILVPRLANGSTDAQEELTTLAAPGFSSFSVGSADVADAAVATYTVRASALDKLSDFLVRGDRKKAYHYALDEKLWAHAMVIASSIDKEAWKEVVKEFVRTELGNPSALAARPPGVDQPSAASNGREPLRVAYNFFAGQGASALHEMGSPETLLQPTLQAPPVPGASFTTPRTPNFPQPGVAVKVSPGSLSKWAETAAVLFSSPMTPDSSAALVTLGDTLMANGNDSAAHACFLLSGPSSLTGGIRNPSARIVLLGARNPQKNPAFYQDQDTIILTEILEFALSLATPTKGQEPFSGLPHLQAFKLVRASSLAEAGHVKLASRYCEAIAGSISRGSPYVHAAFAEQLKSLADRLSAAPHVGKANSWIGGKVAKPTLNGIGSWLEGRLTKFIADEGTEEVSKPAAAATSRPSHGPFANYSEISSATPSGTTSPQPSINNTHVLANAYGHGPPRPGSAASYRSMPVERAASAMDIRRRASPVTRTASAGPGNYGQPNYGTPYGQSNGHAYGNGSQPPSTRTSGEHMRASSETIEEEDGQTASWWGTPAEPSSGTTPMAPTFMSVEQSFTDNDGLVSMATTPTFGHAASYGASSTAGQRVENLNDGDDDDDLGFGNAASKKKLASPTGASPKAEVPEKAEPAKAEKPAAAAASSGSWLGRWWKKPDASSPGPVKASLGEQSTFYYDKEQKRWVSKAAGSEAPKAAAPPPPPTRPQSVVQAPSPPTSNGPSRSAPPPRPASAMDPSMGPKRATTPRIRSGLVPAETDSAPNSPVAGPGSSLAPPPPPSRPKSQASKRSVRSRYVDVFQPSPGES